MKRLGTETIAASRAMNPAEIVLIADSAFATGISPNATLMGTGLSMRLLTQPKCKVSVHQHIGALRNGVNFTGDRLLALRAGSRAHLTAFGIVGYALWSSATLRAALDVALHHASLLNLKCGPSLMIEGDEAVLHFSARVGVNDHDAALLLEFEIAKVLSFLRDLQPSRFRPSRVCVQGSTADFCRRTSILLDCEVIADERSTQIRFPAECLSASLPQANARTHSACLHVCSQLRDAQGEHDDLAKKVRHILANASTSLPSLGEVAAMLCLSERTLRRRLDLINTSYSEIRDDVRKKLAIRYVASTRLTVEMIAEKLAYSDAANFSHAFKRWTGKAPRQYRTASIADIDTNAIEQTFSMMPRPMAHAHLQSTAA